MMKREVFQEDLTILERPKKWKQKSKQVGQRQSWKGSKEARCYKCSEAGYFKRECPLGRTAREEKEKTQIF